LGCGLRPRTLGLGSRAIIFSLRLFRLRIKMASATVVIFVDCFRLRRRVRAAETRVLCQDHRADFGLVTGREADEPGVIFVLAPGFASRRHLRGSGLAADVETIYARSPSSTAAFIDHTVHAVNDDLMNLFAHRHVERVLVLVTGLAELDSFAINSRRRSKQQMWRM